MDFWNEKLDWRYAGDVTPDKSKCARINRVHYIIEPDVTKGFMGFGGREFIILFTSGPHTGQRIVTHNLWCQGDIHEEYKDSLPDNATFLKE